MASVEAIQPSTKTSMDQPSSPRISFSAEFLDETNFISITPKHLHPLNIKDPQPEKERSRNADFEFLSNSSIASSHAAMLTADELFFEGKLLPFWQMQQSEKLHKISIKNSNQEGQKLEEDQLQQDVKEETERVWFVDDDPSPRPPKCTVLWKELLRLKKQKASSSLSPSSSSSSLADIAAAASEEGKAGSRKGDKQGKRIKKGLQRTRSATIRIRPMVNVPICTQMKTAAALPPLFPLKKDRALES